MFTVEPEDRLIKWISQDQMRRLWENLEFLSPWLQISLTTDLSFLWLQALYRHVQPANLGLLGLDLGASSKLGQLTLVLWILWNISFGIIKGRTRLLGWHCLDCSKEAIPSAQCCPALEKWDSLQRHSHSLLLHCAVLTGPVQRPSVLCGAGV